MIKLKVLLFTSLLFLLFPGRLLIIIFQIKGLGVLSSFISAMGLLCLIVCFALTTTDKYGRKIPRLNKYLIIIFIIYSVSLYFDIFINPKLYIEEMRVVPSDIIVFIGMSIRITMMMFMVNMYKKYVDWQTIAKYIPISIGLILAFYWVLSNPFLYVFARELSTPMHDDLLQRNGLIDELTLGNFAGMGYIINLATISSTSRNNKLLSYIVAIICVTTLIILAERGPFLFLITTTIFYLYYKNRERPGFSRKLVLYSILSLLFLAFISVIIMNIAPHFLDRFISVFEDGGSGRFGHSDSVYGSSLQVISRNPLFGDYFRIYGTYAYTGYYAHNIILELIMSIGLVFTIPLIVLGVVSIKNSAFLIRKDNGMKCILIYFIYKLTCMMTSDTTVINYFFWLSFAIALSVYPYRQVKKKIANYN